MFIFNACELGYFFDLKLSSQ